MRNGNFGLSEAVGVDDGAGVVGKVLVRSGLCAPWAASAWKQVVRETVVVKVLSPPVEFSMGGGRRCRCRRFSRRARALSSCSPP
jgi:hypothetical protein